jgi:hypothetical protein
MSDPEKAGLPVKRALRPQERVEGLVLDLDFDDLHSNDDAARAARSVKEHDSE